ncbi:MAG: flagellar type III secretion system protein FlhB [Desulfovibrio sp.]|jgi:flagellar biosynthetic protein FlhB|nr:flagellar type III secretion system protein FlhB [Desulfovibrio sp.]
MAHDPSKTEPATPRRINKARSEGNVAKSQEVTKAVSILAGLIALSACVNYMAGEFVRLFRHFLGSSPLYVDMGEASLYELGLYLTLVLARTTLPAVLFIGLLVYISLRVQVGRLWTTKVFSFKLGRFNLFAGLKRMFISPDTLVRLLKSLLEAMFIGLAPVLAVRSEMDKFPVLYYTDAAGTAAYLLDIGAKMVTYALVPMLIIAAADLVYTRRQYAENLKMSKDEVKDERKQAEGDEKIKAAMKSKMLQMTRRRMLKEVPKADVVITNPTHIAVALRYNAAEAPAPVVVAMGVDKVAEKIKEVAREHGVPIRENKELARALYKQTEIGDIIPPELFQAVAVILAQIWKTRNPGKIPKP